MKQMANELLSSITQGHILGRMKLFEELSFLRGAWGQLGRWNTQLSNTEKSTISLSPGDFSFPEIWRKWGHCGMEVSGKQH